MNGCSSHSIPNRWLVRLSCDSLFRQEFHMISRRLVLAALVSLLPAYAAAQSIELGERLTVARTRSARNG